MKLLQELILLTEADKDLPAPEDDTDEKSDSKEDNLPPVEDDELADQTPTPADDAEENSDEGTTSSDETDNETDDENEEESTEDVGSVAEKEGFVKSSTEMYAFGKTRTVTLLTKNAPLDGLDLTYQYIINPQTGAWSLRACLQGQSADDMVEFTTGEDPSSLVKNLQKKTKITPNQAVQYLKAPADKVIDTTKDEE